MKQKSLLLLTAALSVSLLAGCQGTPQAPADNTPLPEVSGPAITETPAVSAPSVFTPGAWLATGEDGSQQYYFFDADGASGQTASLANGMGLGFAYEYADGQAVFHMGGADDTTPCAVQQDGDALTLSWEAGGTERLVYVSELGADSFTFYSDDALCQLALAYYRQSSGEAGETLTAAAATNEDGTVTIQVYASLGDHNSTAAWYTVDRTTGQGTDTNTGEAVDLTASEAE